VPSTGKDRIEASIKALGTTWLITGVGFCVLVKGPGTVIGWVIWGTGVFLVGWLVIALPLIAIGDRVMRIPALALAFAGGFAGAMLMLSPNLLLRLIQPHVHWVPFSFRDLAWPGIAFAVGFVGVALYRMFLCGSIPRRKPIQSE
jgi:hypothetical protein